MAEDDEKQRAAAKCTRCGAIGIVRIRPDGDLQPLGQSALCDCETSALSVLDDTLDTEEEP